MHIRLFVMGAGRDPFAERAGNPIAESCGKA